MSEYIYNGPQYPAEFFEEDEIYVIGGSRYHVVAIADTKFGRLAWALMEMPKGMPDIQMLLPSMYAQARKE